jgi:hypothetical protein
MLLVLLLILAVGIGVEFLLLAELVFVASVVAASLHGDDGCRSPSYCCLQSQCGAVRKMSREVFEESNEAV